MHRTCNRLVSSLMFGALLLSSSYVYSEPAIRLGVESDLKENPFVVKTIEELKTTFADRPFLLYFPNKDELLKDGQKKFDFAIVNPKTMALLDILGSSSSIGSLKSSFSSKAEKSFARTILPLRDIGQKINTVGIIGIDKDLACLIAKEILTEKENKQKQVNCLSFENFDSLVKAAKEGRVEALVLPPRIFEQRRSELKDLPITQESVTDIGHLSVTGLFMPSIQFAALSGSSPETARYLSMFLRTVKGKKGETWVPPVSLQPIKRMLEKHEDNDFQSLRPTTFKSVIERFYYPIAACLVFFLLFVIHSVLAELKVRKQTAKLLEVQDAKRKAESAVRETQAEMERLERVNIVGQMSSMIAHELKQPITSLDNYLKALKILLDKGTGDKDLINYSINKISESNRRSAEIIEHVRAYAKSGKTHRIRLNISDLALKVLRDFELRVGLENKQKILFISNVQPDIYIEGDELEISLAIYNLLKNSVEALRRKPDGTISLAVKGTEENALVAISDDGLPLSEKQKESLYRPLSSNKSDGLGLGLAIVKRIMESHAGRMNFDFGTEGGLRVTLVFPKDEN